MTQYRVPRANSTCEYDGFNTVFPSLHRQRSSITTNIIDTCHMWKTFYMQEPLKIQCYQREFGPCFGGCWERALTAQCGSTIGWIPYYSTYNVHLCWKSDSLWLQWALMAVPFSWAAAARHLPLCLPAPCSSLRGSMLPALFSHSRLYTSIDVRERGYGLSTCDTRTLDWFCLLGQARGHSRSGF